MPEDRKGVADALLGDGPARLTPREVAMVRYAETLTTAPASIGRNHIDALRAAGLRDREIHDLAVVIAYLSFANRIAQGLGAELEGDQALGQWPPGDVGTTNA